VIDEAAQAALIGGDHPVEAVLEESVEPARLLVLLRGQHAQSIGVTVSEMTIEMMIEKVSV